VAVENVELAAVFGQDQHVFNYRLETTSAGIYGELVAGESNHRALVWYVQANAISDLG